MAAIVLVLVSVAVSAVCPAPAAAPPVIFTVVATAHAYVVPVGSVTAVPVGAYVNGIDVQMLVLCDTIVDAGFSTTLTEKVAPFVQLVGDVGLTVYTAVTVLDVVLVNVAVTEPGVPVLMAPPVKPVPAGAAAHAYVVLAGITPVGV